MPRLIVHHAGEEEVEYGVFDGETTVGRQRGNAIVVADPKVSRSQFSIIIAGNTAMLLNHSKTHGTFVNGMRVDENIQLDDRDQIKIGDTMLTFYLSDPGTALDPDDGGEGFPGENEEGSDHISVNEPDDKSSEDFFAVADPKASSMEQLADETTDAVRLKRIYEQMVLIQEIGQQLVAELSLSDLFSLILKKVFTLLRVDTGAVLLFDPVHKRVVPVAVHNREGVAPTSELKVSRSMVQFAVRNRVGVLSADTQSDERFHEQMSIIARGIRSALCVPMIFQDDILGVIYIDNVITDYAFSKDDLTLLSIVANQAAIAVRNAKLCEQIVTEETKRANLSRFLTPQLVERIAREDIEVGLGGKQVKAAILFSDIRGFTSLSEAMPPTAVVAMLNAYFSEMTEIIFQYLGTLDKYVGDAIIAAFGSPVLDDHACMNALRCAAIMQDRIPHLNLQGHSLQVGIGLHYGEVIHGNVGSERIMQYTVIGDTVNTASRLCSQAKGGQIIMSPAFYENLGTEVEVEALEAVKLKGKAEPMPLFAFTGTCAALV